MSTTHYIATSPTGGPHEVETLHQVGVWAVHFDYEAKLWIVSHTPTGGKVEPCDTLSEAKDIADALGASYSDFAASAEWGKSLSASSEVMEAIRAIVTNAAAYPTRPL